MVRRYVVPFLLAVIAAGGPVAGATAAAAAGTGTMPPVVAVETPPYPPRPQHQPQHQNLESRNQNNSSIKLEKNGRCHRNHCGRRGCGRGACGAGCAGGRRHCSRPHAQGATGGLPFTGAPLALATAVGGGLLGIGVISTLISVRRRRSSDVG